MFKRSVILLLIPFLFSCGRMTAVYPGEMLPNQEKKEYKGAFYIISKDDASIAIAGIVNSPCSSHMRLRVELLMENLGKAPVDFFFQEISASYNGFPLKVFSYSELVQEVYAYRNRQAIILRPGRLRDDDGSGIHQMMYDDRNYPPGNLNAESGRYFDEPSEEARMTVNKTESGFNQSVMYTDDFDLNKLHKESLQNKILMKNLPYRGIVVVEHPEIPEQGSGDGKLEFMVSIGKKTHRFVFDVARIEKK